MFGERLFVPKDEKAHISVGAMHPGSTKMYNISSLSTTGRV